MSNQIENIDQFLENIAVICTRLGNAAASMYTEQVRLGQGRHLGSVRSDLDDVRLRLQKARKYMDSNSHVVK